MSAAATHLQDCHRLSHYLGFLPRCLPTIENVADNFVVASSSRSTARRRSSSAGAPPHFDSDEDAAGEHPCTAIGEDDSL